ncbi:MAG: hypothetical protein JW922_01850 [Paludibacteraceae bacterium]|nr:hypothetical protein [Paludibacteraceae bacterium]
MNKNSLIIAGVILLIVILGLSFSGRSNKNSISPITPDIEKVSGNTMFPVTADAKDVKKLDDTTMNYRSNLSLKEVETFYRDTFTGQGYAERTLNTVSNDTVLSFVFDKLASEGSSDETIVVQATVVQDYVNVNVRYEKVQ